MPLLYMPIEITARELDSRLLIAIFAVRSGLEVLTGPKWLIQKNARWMPKGFWMFKTLTPGDAKYMKRIARLGHRITAIDEEMPGLAESKQQLLWVNDQAVEVAEAIFCMGENHASAMAKKYPNHTEKLIVTGNPRWDFLRPELRKVYQEDCAKIKEKYGRIILINTNIGGLNNARASQEALLRGQQRDGRIDLNRKEDREYIAAGIEWEKANFAAMAPLARRLAAEFKDHLIVLRPHPTEKTEPYQQALEGEERVKIIREGPAAVWLSAAELLVHTGCTTGSEAFALGQTSISFETIPSAMHSHLLSTALSAIAKSEDQVIDLAKKILNCEVDREADAKRRATFNNFFAAQTGAFAAERIAEYLAKSLSAQTTHFGPTWKPGLFFRRRWYATKFQRDIFSSLTATDLTQRLQMFAQTLGDLPVPAVNQVGDGLFHFYPSRG